MHPIDFLIIVTGILDWVLSAAVLVRNKKSEANTSFAVFSFFLGAWAFSIAFFRISSDPLYTFIWAKSIYLSGSFIAASLFYFAYTFPEVKEIPKRVKIFFIVPSVIHALLLALPFYLTRSIQYQSWGNEVILGNIEYLIFSIYFIVFFYGALYVLWKKYKKAVGLVKKQIQFILVSILLAGFVASIFDLFLPWFKNYQLIHIGPATSGIIFLFITYAIVRHKLWDFKLVIVRSFIYSILFLWVISIYTLAVFWISQFLFQGEFDRTQALIYAVLAIFVAFTLQPVKSVLEKITDRVFFKNKYDSSALLSNLTKIMAMTIQLDQLTHKTLQLLLSTMRISRGGFILFKEGKLIPLALQEVDLNKTEMMQSISQVAQLKKIVIFEEVTDQKLKQSMRGLDISIILPLYSSNTLHGMLILGEKKSGDVYSERDLSLLEIFGPEIAVAIDNSLSYEEIRKFNVTLSEEVDKATVDLQRANVKLKEVDKLKTEFVSLASHELRTPMTSIKSYLWMALKGKGGELSEKQKFYLDRAYRSTDRLIKLVNDMLNISRIESGRISLEMQVVDIVKLSQEVLEEVMPRAEELGLKISIDANSLIPKVIADPDKIKEVLINLVGNSMKFTPKGGQIIISFSVNSMVEIHISDNGAGIAQEDMPKLFQKFGLVQGSYEVNKTSTQGTGLGLYICKAIIDMHGGRISARSEGIGKGSVFSFSLQKFNHQLLEQFEIQKIKSENAVGLVHTQV